MASRHGWVTPLPGGAKARCGGPSMCQECAAEYAQLAAQTGRELLPFRQELAALLNKYSAESTANTPDFMLAAYLLSCLAVFETTVKARDEWLLRQEGA